MDQYPPSLDPSVLERSWRAKNGELGVLPADINAFLDACDRDYVPVLGWEIWLIDHQWDGRDGADSATGEWTGLIPRPDRGTCTWTGEGDAAATRREIATLDWTQNIPSHLHPLVRFNFTVDV
jgi:hypothetical protein